MRLPIDRKMPVVSAISSRPLSRRGRRGNDCMRATPRRHHGTKRYKPDPDLYRVVDGAEREITVMRPGNSYATRGDCMYEDLIVRAEDSTEYTRRPGPLCRGDGPWIIENQGD